MSFQGDDERAAKRNPPFHSLSFTMVENKLGRKMLRIAQCDEGFELHVETGSAAHPSRQFTRIVPFEVAQRLKDALDALGVFSWEDTYGDAAAPGSLRWSLNTVFKENVFSVASKGGSDVPAGFDSFLEELYRLDFPRPQGSGASSSERYASRGLAAGLSGLEQPEAGARSTEMNPDLAKMFEGLPQDALDQLSNLDAGRALDAISEIRKNPTELFGQLKEAYGHMSPEERSSLLDALEATGMASRAWWERFFRGL